MTSIFQAGQPFNIVRTSSTTYQANDKDLVISSGDEVALPSPNQGATILVRPAPSIGSVKITTSNGTIGNTGDTFGFYRATEPIYLVGDGTDWYARSGGGEISAIPDSDVYLPMDEGSGTTLNDENGNADATLNTDSWESDSGFKGGTAPKETTASFTLSQTGSLTVVIRMEANPSMSGTGGNGVISHSIFGGQSDPLIEWNDNVSAWRLSDASQAGRCEVSESASSLNGEKRIVAGRWSSSESKLDVYDNSLSAIGSDSASNGDETFNDDTTSLADAGNWDNFDQLFYKLDYLTDAELSDLLNGYYA